MYWILTELLSHLKEVAELFDIVFNIAITKKSATDHLIIDMPQVFQQMTTFYLNYNHIKYEFDHLNPLFSATLDDLTAIQLKGGIYVLLSYW